MTIRVAFNVTLRGFESRILAIQKFLRDNQEELPSAIEIFLVPENYPRKYSQDLPEKGIGLTKQMINKIGTQLKRWKLETLIIHYPWQMSLLDNGGKAIQATLLWTNEMMAFTDAEYSILNHHFVTKWPDFKLLKSEDTVFSSKEFRRKLLELAGLQTSIVRRWIKQVNQDIRLTIENNPACSTDKDMLGNVGADSIDQPAEDFKDRSGCDGCCLDISHAWSSVEYFRSVPPSKTIPNLEWARRYYNGIPRSCRSLHNYFTSVSNTIFYLHLADAKTFYKHEGLEIGKGKIDWGKVIELIDKYCRNCFATLEISGAHTPKGFECLKRSFMFLKNLRK